MTKPRTKLQILRLLRQEWVDYWKELDEYDRKAEEEWGPDQVSRTDEATLVDFGYYLIRPDK